MNTSQQLGIQVPFHRADLGEEEVQAVAEVIRSGWLTMGAKTFEFERQFAEYIGSRFAVAVSSCTAALHLCLEAVGIRVGDEVLVPAITFTATAEIITYLGACPVLVDIDPKTMNLDLADAKRRVTSKTRAVVPVHFSGQPCDMEAICDFASAYNLHIVEDAAHALPSFYRGAKVGTLSEMTAFSFYATKTLSTGEGGMITTDNENYAQRMQMMRLHGISRDAWKRYSGEGSWYYEVLEMGYKYNMTDMQAALGIVQLSKCDWMNERRKYIANAYTKAFHKMPALEVPQITAGNESSWHLYVLRLKSERLRIDRAKFIQELKSRGVGSSVHFIPLHYHPAYQARFGYKPGDFPNAEKEYDRCVSLPIYSGMTDEEVDYVISAIKEIVAIWSL